MRAQLIFATSLLILTGCSSSSDADQRLNKSDGAQNDDTQTINAPPVNGTTINLATYEQILKQAVHIANLADIQQARQVTYNLAIDIYAGGVAVLDGEPALDGIELLSQTLIRDEQNTIDITQQQYACIPNGFLTLNIRDFGNAPWGITDIAFDQCNYKGVDYSGAYTQSNGRRSDWHDTFQQFQSNHNDQSVELTGTRQWVYPWFQNKEELLWSIGSLIMVDNNATTAVSDMEWRREGIDSDSVGSEIFHAIDLEGMKRKITEKIYQSNITTNFQLSSDATQQIAVSVSIELDFNQPYFSWVRDSSSQPTYPVSDLGTPLIIELPESSSTVENFPFNDIAQWQTGSITISAPDGSVVTARPFAEDRSKVVIELNGSSELIMRNWNEGFQVDCSALISGCGNNARMSY